MRGDFDWLNSLKESCDQDTAYVHMVALLIIKELYLSMPSIVYNYDEVLLSVLRTGILGYSGHSHVNLNIWLLKSPNCGFVLPWHLPHFVTPVMSTCSLSSFRRLEYKSGFLISLTLRI